MCSNYKPVLPAASFSSSSFSPVARMTAAGGSSLAFALLHTALALVGLLEVVQLGTFV
jgi:hypothetical protein